MRRDVDGLDHLADGATLDQFAGIDRGLHLQPFGIHDGEDAPRLSDGLSHQRQVFQGGDAGLVGEKILARLHGPHADARTLVGDL